MVKYRPFFASRFLKIVVPERNIYKVSIDDESLMASLLTIAPVDQLQSEIASSVRERTTPGIYVSLNKSHKGSETFLKKAKVNTQQLFFIDCVTTEKKEEGAIHVSPDDLEILKSTIYSFVDQIKGRHFLVIDALSTLLIYNNENSVCKFIKEIIDKTEQKDVDIRAFSPETKGEELLTKVFNFFDQVDRK